MHHIRAIFGKPSVKYTALLVGGTLISQITAALAIPLLSRIYSPDAFGRFSLFLSVSGVLSVVVSLRYELAIPLPEQDKDAANLLTLVLSLVVGISSAVLAIVCFASFLLVMSEDLRSVLWAVPLSLLATGMYSGLSYWALRRKRFGGLAAAQVGSSTAPIVQVVLGLLNVTGIGLVVGQLAGQWTALLMLARGVWHVDRSVFRGETSRAIAKSLALRYRRFPMLNAPQALFNTISQNVPVLLFSQFFEMQVVGYYGLAVRVLQVPINLLSQSYQQVFLQRITEERRVGTDLVHLLNSATLMLACVGAIPSLIVIAFGPQVFSLIFGTMWADAGSYARWLTFLIVTSFAVSPSNMVLIASERLQFLFVFDLAQFAVKMTAVLIGAAMCSAELSVALFSAAGVSFNIIMFLAALRATRSPRREEAGDILHM